MKKKFVKVMFYSAIALATSTSFVGCADYDDDVQNLQNQIDEINKKSPLVSVEEMTAAINSAIQQLEEKLNESISGNTGEIDNLKTLVAQLQEALNNKADKSQIEDILNQIQELSKQMDANFENVNEILETCVQIEEFNSLKEQVEALQEANKDFATKGELEAYVSKEELAGLLDEKILSELQEGGDIYEVVNEIVTNAIASQIEGIYVTMSEYNQKIQELTEQMKKYATQEGLDDLSEKVTYLEETVIAAIKASVDKNTEDIASLVTEVNGLKEQLNTLMTSYEGLSQKIDDAVKSLEEQLASINEQIKALDIRLESLETMIQSIVYAPEYADGKLMFNRLDANNGKNSLTVIDNNIVEVKFRVSPAGAAKDFETKYNITFEGYETPERKTRSGNGLLNVLSYSGDEATGMVTMQVEATEGVTANMQYALCAHVTAKATEENTDKATDVTSDYFEVYRNIITAHSAELTNLPEERVIYFGEAETSIDFSQTGYILKDENDNEIDMDQFEQEKKDAAIDITYTATNEAYFTFENDLLKLKSYTASADDKTTNVNAILNMNGVRFAFNNILDPEVTAMKSEREVEVVYEAIVQEWNKDEQSYDLNMDKIFDESGITPEEFNSSNFDSQITLDGVKNNYGQDPVYGFIGWPNSNGIRVYVNAGTGAKADGTDYELVFTFTNKVTAERVVVKQPVRITYDKLTAENQLAVDARLWSGAKDNGTLMLTPQGENDQITYTYILDKAFTNWNELSQKVAALGGKVAIDVNDSYNNLSYTMNGTTMTLNPTRYNASLNNIVMTAKVSFGNKVTDVATAQILVENVSGAWTKGTTEIRFTKNLKEKFNLWEGFKWNSALDQKLMWGDNYSTYKPFADKGILEAYGLEEPKFVLSTDAKKFFTITSNGVLEYIGDAEGFASDYTFTIDVQANSRWGAIEGYEGNHTITVTVPAGLKLN